MVDRSDLGLSVTPKGRAYFLVPDPLKREFKNFCETHPQYKFSPSGETGSHVAWDYTEYESTPAAAEDAVEYLQQFEL